MLMYRSREFVTFVTWKSPVGLILGCCVCVCVRSKRLGLNMQRISQFPDGTLKITYGRQHIFSLGKREKMTQKSRRVSQVPLAPPPTSPTFFTCSSTQSIFFLLQPCACAVRLGWEVDGLEFLW